MKYNNDPFMEDRNGAEAVEETPVAPAPIPEPPKPPVAENRENEGDEDTHEETGDEEVENDEA